MFQLVVSSLLGDQILQEAKQVVRLGTQLMPSPAIRQAMNAGRFKVAGATLYVTMEPCLCAGAILLARLDALSMVVTIPRWGRSKPLHRLSESA